MSRSTVLPPLSGGLKVDKDLKLSHDDFKQSIMKFHDDITLSAIDQLKATTPYPSPHVLAQFASIAYSDCKHGDPEPPDGWKLLTTATNSRNGYFGTAYWHQEHQQVVIAHRGTETVGLVAFLKDFCTDIKGPLRNNYVQQMSSASTFANKVVSVLQEIEQDKKVSYELFFTGHSLGGWLAQITNFTTEYLEVKGRTFLKKLKTERDGTLASSTVQDSRDVKQSYHPHTVLFDSPGCKDMLLQMADKLDVRQHGSSIVLQHLDITSYLSAPNRINTCNTHLGAVYRIFTDLSDMTQLEKHTALYNLATHRLDKIVECFDPQTGQVYKDDEGEPKIRQVVDWPVSAGLMVDTELNNFFEWAEHLNNYHPKVMDISHRKDTEGYHPLRYQTKAYDECTKSLSVFTQDEREFVQRYRWLCDMKDFFRPEDLFCVMKNAEAEKEAQEELCNFEVDNEEIRCPDASTLQEVIPYVKRLIRLYPQLKDKAKDQLSPLHIRESVYHCETLRYVAKIRQSSLDFNSDALGLSEFLDGDKQVWQLRIIDGAAWTGITKFYRVLQKTDCTPNRFSGSKYTILDLERLLTVNRMISLNALLTSIETPHLLMIACGANQTVNDELENMFQEMFSILEQKRSMKVVLTAQSEDSTADFIQQIATETLGEGFITTDEQLTWGDLTSSSQREVLERTVLFQGSIVALNQLTSAESLTGSFPLADFVKETELRVGEEPVPSAYKGYNEKYYIDRTFNQNIVIRQDILSDKQEGKFTDLLARNEEEFKQFSQQNPTKNVHLLVEGKSRELVWQQTQGNLKALRKYIDVQKPQSYAPSDLDKLLQQAKNHRSIIIADKAGMGKTTVLTHMSKRIKQEFPALWLVRIDLNDYTEVLKAVKGNDIAKEWVFQFLSKEVLKLGCHLEKELFKNCFEGNGFSKVVVMVDGFDEVSPTYKEKVSAMLQVLKQTTSLDQLWVTTRPHLREDLEDNLQQLSYTLQPFSEFEQVHFLEKFWPENLNLDVTDHNRLQIYAKTLIRKLAQSISDKDKQFTSIPLQTRMIAEAFEQEFRSFYLSEKSEPELPHKLDLLGLYGRFIERKYDMFYEEKSRLQIGNTGAKEIRDRDYKNMQLQHQLLALEALFTEEQLKSLQINYQPTLSDDNLARIGIVHKSNEGKPQFMHRTFAELYVAEFLIKELKLENKPQAQVHDFLLNEVLLKADYHVIRAFLDGLLEESKPSEEILKDYGQKLDERWNEREERGPLTGETTALFQAATEDNANIIGFIEDSLKSADCVNTVTEMMLARDDKGRNAFHMAGKNCSLKALDKMSVWLEGVVNIHRNI